MKITVNRESFATSLGVAYLGIDQKPSIPIWNCFYFEIKDGKMHIYSRSESLQIKTFQKVESKEDGIFVAPARKFYETIKLLRCEEVDISVINNEKTGITVKIKPVGQRKSYSMVSYDSESFSTLKGEDSGFSKITSSTIGEALRDCASIVNKDDLRTTFSGVSIRNREDMIEVSSTDGYMLCRSLIKTDIKFEDVIIPKQSAEVIPLIFKEGFVDLKGTKNNFIAKDGTTEVISAIINTKYPEVNQFWESEYSANKHILVNKTEFLNSLKILGLYSISKYRMAKFSINDSDMTIDSESEDKNSSAEETIEVNNLGNPNTESGYNIMLIQKIIGFIETDTIKMSFVGKNKPVFIEEPSNNSEFNKSFLLQAVFI